VGKFMKAVGGADLNESKRLFLEKTNAVAEASILTAADKPLSDSQKMKLRLDAVLNDLIDILEPKGQVGGMVRHSWVQVPCQKKRSV
jgi:hypothetical protein